MSKHEAWAICSLVAVIFICAAAVCATIVGVIERRQPCCAHACPTEPEQDARIRSKIIEAQMAAGVIHFHPMPGREGVRVLCDEEGCDGE